MKLLAGKVVFITGGSAGQGRQHAITSAEAGANIVVVDIHPEGDERYISLAQEIESHGQELLVVQADVTEGQQLTIAVEKTMEQFGRVDALVANAGVFRPSQLHETAGDDWDLIFNINLKGVWNSIAAVSAKMTPGGSIVLIGSVDGIDPWPGGAAYGTSKAAVHALMRNAAAELGPRGIRVNAIAPGFVDTDMVSSPRFLDSLAGGPGLGTREHLLEFAKTKSVLSHRGIIDPKEIAHVALFLNSSLASAVTGALMPVDAGFLTLPHAKRS